MECGLLVLRVGSIAIRGKKVGHRGNFRASASCQPIYEDKNTLIDLFSTWEIRVEGVNGRNGVDGEPVKIWSHVGNLVGSVNPELMRYEFSEC